MFKSIVDKIHEFNAARELKNYRDRINGQANNGDLDNILSTIFDEPYNRFFWILQVRTEFTSLCRRVENLRPKTILEIGTARGGSLFAFVKLADPAAQIFSIDLPNGDFGGGYPAYRRAFYESFKRPHQQLSLMRTDSHLQETVDTLKELLKSQPLDFLFIDGDHTYEGVKKDFELYAPMVRSGGLIAFHDIAEHPAEWNVGVRLFWNELKEKFATEEFIENTSQGWGGIGIINGFDPRNLHL